METERVIDRTVYIDYLRIFATFSVMILHVSVQNWYTSDVNGFDWNVFNIYDSVVRWSVPVFVMISGSLFLNRDIEIKRIYKKNIFKMVIAFISWGLIYALFLGGNWKEILIHSINGYYHMWFIPMVIALYMCVPIIKPIVKTRKNINYFLILAFIFVFLFPQIKNLIDDFGRETIKKIVNLFYSNIANMSFSFISGYTCYFIGGYYISTTSLNRKQRIIIYILGIIGFAMTIILNAILSIKIQNPTSNYYGNFTINVMLESLAVFVWFKYNVSENAKIDVFIRKMAKYSFGAYLVHVLVIEQLYERFGVNTLSFNSAISVPAIGVLVFIISFIISAIINHIPESVKLTVLAH